MTLRVYRRWLEKLGEVILSIVKRKGFKLREQSGKEVTISLEVYFDYY
jgi:hypothetical protein